ncbi:hypothetical protein CVT26_001400 [Gymnopilus dilepis]|uniref:Uncharacterized protein n=1 Tax=Gymnopilus dilepis TaxID=231916 RepID=A0A409W7Z5_9AGAR|nr:hypothetical protein CVT26_001400 [Gymnopilus dilepis]
MTSSPCSPRLRYSTPAQAEQKTSWTAQSRIPASTELYKVLSSFNLEETRRALGTLSKLYATPVKGTEVQTAPAEEREDQADHERVDPSQSSAAILLAST